MYARILVPVDGSATAERGLREAIAWAGQVRAELVLLRVLDDDPVSIERTPARYAEEARDAAKRAGETLIAGYVRLAHESGARARGVVRDGLGARVSDVILEEVKAQDCQLVIMGTHGRRGFDRLALGSDAEVVARRAPVPVLLVRHPKVRGDEHRTD
jgi:nucleotide-binding universal stress UspA family protein